jgi:endonuclease/exonuclease/phosphatase family metal-dependent hydrolase
MCPHIFFCFGTLFQDGTVLKTVEPYGVAMLSRYPFERLELHETHSLMQRNALLAEINADGHKAPGDHSLPS